MDAHLRAGVAIYNAGGYHAAHDAWEDHWLDLESGTADERFLHGLIQFTAAVYHATEGNDSGATGLAESAREYLADLSDDYRGVNVAEVREFLAALAADPALLDDRDPLSLRHGGQRLTPEDLDLEATCVAAAVLAEEEGYDEETVERAAAYARADAEGGATGSPFVPLVFDFVRDADNRGIIFQRLSEHVARRRSREDDVSGLFE
ncbi:DUF309 domain-containing protein [Salinirussus salinus]|jgi:predicted metal-dependent hydrolase|uniref:DUF309 domain-containing protein n=1 Tax=Salinirussus salinus TaxID=1198300 RepID=UPI0013580D4F|nr:DUF309 domain-containing protein [Salinirussus salinus]